MGPYYVYLHRRATNSEVFYVGKGRAARAHSRHMRNPHWHRVVARDGFVVEIVEDGLSEARAFELESMLIQFFGRRDLGLGKLVNLTDGGEGTEGSSRGGETAQKISAALKGRKRSPEAVEASRRGNQGKKRSPEHISAMMAKVVGRVVSDETRAKLSAARKGIKMNPEHKAKLIAIHTGRKKSADELTRQRETRERNKAMSK